jgi:OOP family OmpA-OmpF porin
MKKLALSALLAASLMQATDFNYEISPVAGYLWNSVSGNEKPSASQGPIGGVQNHAVYGIEAQANNLEFFGIKPELSVLYGRDTVNQNTIDTNGEFTGVLDTMINGVYEVDTGTFVTPFVKAGAGYEWYTNTHPTDFDGIIVDAGLGLKADLTKHIALKLEGLYMYKMNNNGDEGAPVNGSNGSNGEVHNVAALAGLTFSFDEKAAPVVAAAVVAPVVVEEVVAPVVVPVPVEKCADAPKGFVLDDNCQPLKKSFNINFPFDSATITDTEAPKVSEFATFLKDSPAYKTELVGYTDSKGTEKYNQKLSEKRAAAVKAQLEKEGVAADRLTTSGKGEMDPVADNKTEEGRWLNRRVDANLIK